MINLNEYINGNKDILNDRLRTASLLSDYFNGDKVKVKRMMKGYDIGIVKLFKEKDGFFDLKQKIIQTLIEEEDLQEQIALEIYLFWNSVFNGNKKYCYLGDFYIEKIDKRNAKAYHCLMGYIGADAWSKIEEISFYSDINLDTITDGILIKDNDSVYKTNIENNCLNIYTSAQKFTIPNEGIITEIKNKSFVYGYFAWRYSRVEKDKLETSGFFSLFKGLKKINNIKNIYVTNCRYMFVGCKNLEEIDFSGFDTSKVTNMCEMFGGCKSLKELDLSSFDTSKVANMRAMFACCESLKELDVSSFDTSKVADMTLMFHRCKSLKELDVSGFDTSKVTRMAGMFNYCESLKEIDVSDFDTSKVTYMGCMFYKCNTLKEVDVSGFDTSKVTSMQGMFAYCENLKKIIISRSFGRSIIGTGKENFVGCKTLKEIIEKPLN